MKNFYQVLLNSLIAGTTNNYVWFALTFWAFLETRSVLATSIMMGIYLTITAISGFWLGSIVDHYKKKTAMMFSSIASLLFFCIGLTILINTPSESFKTIESVIFWVFTIILLLGVLSGNLRNITLPTVTTILVDEKERDKANGLSGTIMGISFAITSVASGLALAYLGMTGVMILAIVFTLLAIGHLFFLSIPEKNINHSGREPRKLDIKGTIAAVAAIPGLFALIFYTTLNNFLGGVFMSLMDAYGLTLVSVQVWGILWGFLSLGFILGGFFIAKKGLGKNPLKTLFLANLIMWTVSIFFTIQPWIWLLIVGMFIWICLVPFIEATEQTIIQKVVPVERQGRVFGFAQSVEQAASPLTAFFIGPIAQFVFIPFMTNGAGVNLIGGWFGTGMGRGIALLFTVTGIIGLFVTLIAMQSKSYKLLSDSYQK